MTQIQIYTVAQAKQLQEIREDFDVRFAMTYGEPSIAKVISEMKESGVEEITVLPLYPQYSLTTVEPVIQQVKQIDDKIKVIIDFHKVESYSDLLAKSIREKWEANHYDKLVLSYHGIPLSYL